MSAFPILRLPLLSLKNVFDIMDMLELTRLSICNKRLRELIKPVKSISSIEEIPYQFKNSIEVADIYELLHLKSSKEEFLQKSSLLLEVEVNHKIRLAVLNRYPVINGCYREFFRWYFHVEEIGKSNQFNGVKIDFRAGDITVPAVIENGKELYTFWEDRIEGVKTLVPYFMKTLKFPLNGYNILQGYKPNELRAITDWMNSNQLYAKNCFYYQKRGVHDEDFRYILDNVTATNEYHIDTEEHYTPYKPLRRFDATTFTADFARWFTFDTLLLTNCAFIDVTYNGNITNKELNEYIRRWMKGEFPKLKHIKVRMAYLSTQQILSGLPVTTPKNRNIKNYQSRCESVNFVYNAVDLHNQNGLIGTFPSPLCSGEMDQQCFQFVVWPDMNGVNPDRSS